MNDSVGEVKSKMIDVRLSHFTRIVSPFTFIPLVGCSKISNKSLLYVYCRKLYNSDCILLHHHAVLGLLGKYPKARQPEMALRAVLLGLCHWYFLVLAAGRIYHGKFW